MTAKTLVQELRENLEWQERACGRRFENHPILRAIHRLEVLEWMERAAAETPAAPQLTCPHHGARLGILPDATTACVICLKEQIEALKTARLCDAQGFEERIRVAYETRAEEQTEPRRMYELDGSDSGSDERPAGAAIAESRLQFTATEKTTPARGVWCLRPGCDIEVPHEHK